MNNFRYCTFSTWCFTVVATFFIPACAASLQSKSSGSVGCAPSEITISNETSSFGWFQGVKNWVAECRGQRYFCSETTNTGSIVSATDSKGGHVTAMGGNTTETHCTAETESSDEPTVSAPKPVVSAKERSAAPSGGGGFDFGASAEKAKEVCEGSEQTWTELGKRVYLCSAAPIDLGFPAEIIVQFCQNVVCSSTVVHRPNRAWIKAYRDLKAQLESKYGASESGPNGLPRDCAVDSALLDCINNEMANLSYTWKWPTGERISLLLTKDNELGREPAIRIQYVKPPTAIKVKTDAL